MTETNQTQQRSAYMLRTGKTILALCSKLSVNVALLLFFLTTESGSGDKAFHPASPVTPHFSSNATADEQVNSKAFTASSV